MQASSQKALRNARDEAILEQDADFLNSEAADVLEYQELPDSTTSPSTEDAGTHHSAAGHR
jgi:hypothetical protein